MHAAKDEVAAQWGLATHTKSGGYVGWAAMHIRRGTTWAINGDRGQVSEAELLYAVQAMLENGVPSRCAAAPVRHLVISIAYHKAWVSAAETVKARFPQLTMHHFHDEESWRKVGAALKARGIDFDAFDPVMRDAVEVGRPARTLTRQSLDTAGTRPPPALASVRHRNRSLTTYSSSFLACAVALAGAAVARCPDLPWLPLQHERGDLPDASPRPRLRGHVQHPTAAMLLWHRGHGVLNGSVVWEAVRQRLEVLL